MSKQESLFEPGELTGGNGDVVRLGKLAGFSGRAFPGPALALLTLLMMFLVLRKKKSRCSGRCGGRGGSLAHSCSPASALAGFSSSSPCGSRTFTHG